jgi:hypothetical protein
MVKRTNRRFAKQKKEQARRERATAKRARKQARASHSGQPGDPDFEEVVPGPQPKDDLSEEEKMRAVERAMRPQTQGSRTRRAGSAGPRLFVGNLDYGTEEQDLRELFAGAGFSVTEASLVLDRETGQSRGFAFVQLADAAQAEQAIGALHGTQFNGRELRVNSADPSGRG